MFHFDPQELYERLIKLGKDYAQKQAQADLYEDSKKIIFSDLISSDNEEISIAQKQSKAYASYKYKEHIKEAYKKRKEANLARVEYEAFKIYIDMLRTQQSNLRAEMNMEKDI
jgi:hypothetical protein